MVNKVFKDKIDYNMKVCIDDMIIKSFKKVDHIKTWKKLSSPFIDIEWSWIWANTSSMLNRQVSWIHGYQA